ncbi:MAG TPA: hypothetical protein VJ279_08375 [Hanamia sp.]|jgi:hypothetical protein|nr:hypothetical protein [Hanamia sp.]
MQDFDINKVSLRALKIIRKGYKNSRSNPETREKLQQINALIDLKERKFTKSKKIPQVKPAVQPKVWPPFINK